MDWRGGKEAGEGGGGIKRFLVVRRWDADPQPPRVNYIPGKPYRIILAPRRGFVQTVGTSPYRCSRARGYESLKSLRREGKEGGEKDERVPRLAFHRRIIPRVSYSRANPTTILGRADRIATRVATRARHHGLFFARADFIGGVIDRRRRMADV